MLNDFLFWWYQLSYIYVCLCVSVIAGARACICILYFSGKNSDHVRTTIGIEKTGPYVAKKFRT